MSRSLRELLAAPRLDRMQRGNLARAVRHPAVLADDVRGPLAAHGLAAPAPRPGDPLLLAATREEGSIWILARPDDPDARELLDGARAAWRVAGRVAARAMPVLGDPSALVERDPPRLSPLSAFPPSVEALDGASFGLAFALAHVSLAAGVPIGTDVAATAEILPDGTARPVTRLEQKLDALRRWAPGVRRLLVAASQAEEARALAARLGADLEIAGVGHVGDALPHAFDEASFDAALVARWTADPDAARRAAEAFFRFVLGEPAAALRWAAVQRALGHLRDLGAPDVRWRAAVAHAVAARHAGEPLPLPPPPPGLRLPRDHRLALLAHRVQAHNDAAADGWEALAEEALAAVFAPDDEGAADLELLGALGRLHASWGRFDGARALLRRAVHGWVDLDELPEASYPLSELVRVEGLAGDPAGLDALDRLVRACLADPRTTDHARAFLHLALGRARVCLGQPDLARRHLADDAAWVGAYRHVQASRLRWLARVDPVGVGGRAPLERLASLAAEDPEAGFAWRLARADRGDAGALDGLDPADARQLARCRHVAGGALARALDLFPY